MPDIEINEGGGGNFDSDKTKQMAVAGPAIEVMVELTDVPIEAVLANKNNTKPNRKRKGVPSKKYAEIMDLARQLPGVDVETASEEELQEAIIRAIEQNTKYLNNNINHREVWTTFFRTKSPVEVDEALGLSKNTCSNHLLLIINKLEKLVREGIDVSETGELTAQAQNTLDLLTENDDEQVAEGIVSTLRWMREELDVGITMEDCKIIAARLGYKLKNPIDPLAMDDNAAKLDEIYTKLTHRREKDFLDGHRDIKHVLGLFSIRGSSSKMAYDLKYIKSSFECFVKHDPMLRKKYSGVEIDDNTIRILIMTGLAKMFAAVKKKGIRWGGNSSS